MFSTPSSTPSRHSKPKLSSSITPLTPITPSTTARTLKVTSPLAPRTPLSSFQNVAFTPPNSLPRHTNKPSRSSLPNILSSESWRKPSTSQSPASGRENMVPQQNTLLPAAVIGSRRSADLPKKNREREVFVQQRKSSRDERSEFSLSDSSDQPVYPMSKRLASLTTMTPATPPAAAFNQKSDALARTQALSPPGRGVSAAVSQPRNVESTTVVVKSCVSCRRSAADGLVLSTCSHTMCKQCFTSSLNIVGEKRFSCPECGEPIQDFKFLGSGPAKSSEPPHRVDVLKTSTKERPAKALNATHTNVKVAPSAPRAIDAPDNTTNLAVLRLDDVPWDVTPNMLSAWAGIPPYQAHVLLDRDGKTSSHAYIEAKPGSGEASAKDILVACRNKVLGTGKRARRVTITLSSQDELLKDIFPSWLGCFINSQPNVQNLAAQHVPAVMSQGLIPLLELEIIARRVFQPDRRYVKDPSLPYYSLISIINKFPTDPESRAFWSFGTRDIIYSIGYSALYQLINTVPDEEEWKSNTIGALGAALLVNPIFTTEQLQAIHLLFPSQLEQTGSAFQHDAISDNYMISSEGLLEAYHPSDSENTSAPSSLITPPVQQPLPLSRHQQSRLQTPTHLSSSSIAASTSESENRYLHAQNYHNDINAHSLQYHDDNVHMYAPPSPSPLGFENQHAANNNGLAAFQPNDRRLWSPYDAIANDLGVEPHVVQAVCQRLAICSLV